MNEHMDVTLDLQNPENYNIIKARLNAMLGNVTIAYARNREMFNQNCLEINQQWDEALKISEILSDLKTAPSYGTPKLESMNKMFGYLGLVESLGTTIMDMLLMVLILNGIEIHTRGPDVRHIRLFRELKDPKQDVKLEILKREGFGFFKTIIDKTTRDDIAHLKFTIDDDGVIRRRDKGASKIPIQEKIEKFWKGVNFLRQLFEDVNFFSYFLPDSSGDNH